MRRIIMAIALGVAAIGGGLWGLNVALGGPFWGISGDEYVDVEASLPVLQQGDEEYPDEITYLVQLNTDPNVLAAAPINVIIQETKPRESGDPVISSGAVSLLVPLNDAGTPVRAEPHKLAFHSGNWNTPQPIRIASVDDNIDAPDREVDIEHDFANYLTSSVKIRVTVHDDDERGLMLPESLNVRGLQSSTYEFHLATQPQDGEDVVVEVKGDGLQVASNGGEHADSVRMTFVNADWDKPQSVSVMSARRGLSPGAHPFKLMHKAVSGSDYADAVTGELDVTVNVVAVVARPRATATPRLVATSTPRPTQTPTPEPAPAAVEDTPTPTRTLVPTLTPTPSATGTPAPTPTFTATPPPTATPQADDSPPRDDPPADNTATAEAAIEATATMEAVDAATATAVAGIQATATAVYQLQATATAVSEIAATATAGVAATATTEAAATSTAIAGITVTAEAQNTATAVAQATSTVIARATGTAEAVATNTAVAQLTRTAIPAATATAVAERQATATAVSIIQTAIAIETVIPQLQATATAQAVNLATAVAGITATAEADRRSRELGTPGALADAGSQPGNSGGIGEILARATAEARELGATATAVAIAQAGGRDPRFNELGTPLSVPEITATAIAQDEAIAAMIAESVEATQTAIAGGVSDSGGGDFGGEILDIADGAADFLGPLAIPVGVGIVAAIVAATIAVTKKLALAKVFKMALRFMLRG